MNLVDKVLGVQKILPETMVKNKADRAIFSERHAYRQFSDKSGKTIV